MHLAYSNKLLAQRFLTSKSVFKGSLIGAWSNRVRWENFHFLRTNGSVKTNSEPMERWSVLNIETLTTTASCKYPAASNGCSPRPQAWWHTGKDQACAVTLSWLAVTLLGLYRNGNGISDQLVLSVLHRGLFCTRHAAFHRGNHWGDIGSIETLWHPLSRNIGRAHQDKATVIFGNGARSVRAHKLAKLSRSIQEPGYR